MLHQFVKRDLGPIGVAALTAAVVLAIFTWTERTVVVDPDGLSASHWPWRLWQIPPLVFGIGGVWWIWLRSERESWLRCLALALLALAVLVNAYTGGFGEHAGNVWRTINPLFIAGSSVAAVACWRRGDVASRACAAASAALGVLVFVNAYFVNEGVVWQIADPLMILSVLGWAASSQADASAPEHYEAG
ncbi:MAG: hypothetical protein OXH38_05190 [Chloroflexi bacterium]|nr:hypothetical protein [Chloroflexota bacterium]